MRRMLVSVAVVAAAVAGFWAEGGEDEGKVKAAREICDENKDAVVWVRAVLKMQMSGFGAMLGHDEEEKVEALGVVVDPAGLTVVSLSKLDPTRLMQEMSWNVDGEEKKITPTTKLSDVKIHLSDGTEVPAKMALEDKDLDIAIIVPDKKEAASLPVFKSVKSAAPAQKMRPLDDVVVVSRLGKSLDRQPTAELGRIAGVVVKPRTFYFCGAISSLGAPVFSLDKKIVGVVSIHSSDTKRKWFAQLAADDLFTPVVIPIEDIMEITRQVSGE